MCIFIPLFATAIPRPHGGSFIFPVRLIDVFVNSVHVYDDKIIVLVNYKDGEKCISLDELGDKEKKPSTQNKCSTLIMSGDPSGNRTRDTLIKSQVLYRLS